MVLTYINGQQNLQKSLLTDLAIQVVEFAALPGSVFRHTQSCSCVTFSNEHEADTALSHDKEAVCRKVK